MPLTALAVVVRVLCAAYLLVLVAGVVIFKAAFVEMVLIKPLFTAYGLLVTTYLLSRFGLALFYRPAGDVGHEPSVAIVMPAFNEERAIGDSIRSLLAVTYPEEKLEIVVVNDGSTDATGRIIAELAAQEPRVRAIDFPVNLGKRAAMAAGIRATVAEVIVFVDSDSVIDPSGIRWIVQDFADCRVGAVAGHADVLNADDGWLARMQEVRYYVAFRVMKAAESLFSAVTCCSGCFSAYRRDALVPHLERWEHQRFLGVDSTFGDDRALTNCVLRDYRVRYQSRARSRTIVPTTLRGFMRQQARWKRSWARESLAVTRFIWRKHPAAAAGTYIGIILPLIAPLVMVRAVIWLPSEHGGLPLAYLLGIYAMALVYGLYYEITHDGAESDGLWIYGMVFVFFYVAVLVWQTYYSLATLRTARWGTRPATAGARSAEVGAATASS